LGTAFGRVAASQPRGGCDQRKLIEVVGGVSLDDFYAYMPAHSYIYAPTREMWPSASVNARLASPEKDMSASSWLDRQRAVEQMTWAPGLPMLIANRLVSEGGWIERKGVTCFNLYRSPMIKLGNPVKVGPWLDHVRRVFGDDADPIVKWLAHRVQRPAEKINRALVLGGAQGIGKDTMLEAVKMAVGPWNFSEVSPQQLLGRFNGYLKSVVLRVSEARDLGDVDRFQFYEMLERAKETTRCGKYTYIEYARFADDLVILIDAHPRHDWLMVAVEKRLREELAKLQVDSARCAARRREEPARIQRTKLRRRRHYHEP